jgi:hypothetical protein
MNPANRFTLLDANGNELPAGSTNHAFFIDNALGVMHQVDDTCEEKNWKDAEKACAEYRALGFDNWRQPAPQEELAVVDYDTFNPAVNRALIPNPKNGWVWTCKPDPSGPAGYAFCVDFDNGLVGFASQSLYARVRAVRSVVPAGQ